jgi:hypothetical protein
MVVSGTKLLMNITTCSWKIAGNVGVFPGVPRAEESVPIPPMMRRRLTALGKMAIEGIYRSVKSLEEKGLLHDIRWVTACRNGDTPRMVQLLSNISNEELLSPTDFSMSVHNGLIGMFSIESKNPMPHTALSGADASFEAGLLEAYAIGQESQRPVGFCYYDIPLPDMYEGKDHGHRSDVFILMILEPDQNAGSGSPKLKMRYETYEVSKIEDAYGLIRFIEFLENDHKSYKLHIPGGLFRFEKSV